MNNPPTDPARGATATPRAPADDELAALLAQVALGDRQAFARLYGRTKSLLYSAALRIAGERALAEEVLQDTFVNVWRGAAGYDPAQGQPLAWLVSIARHRAIDLRRRSAASRAAERPAQSDDDGPDAIDAAASPLPEPAALHMQRREEQRLRECLGQLAPAPRQAISLAYYQGFSHAEVAAHLMQPLGSVKSWIRRGLLALRECLGGATGG